MATTRYLITEMVTWLGNKQKSSLHPYNFVDITLIELGVFGFGRLHAIRRYRLSRFVLPFIRQQKSLGFA